MSNEDTRVFRIECATSDYCFDYIDPISGNVFESDQHKADMVCFMLNEQNRETYTVKEVKNA